MILLEDQYKLMEDYIQGRMQTQCYINRFDVLEMVCKDIQVKKALEDNYFDSTIEPIMMFSMFMTTITKDDMLINFGTKGIRPKGLGEGPAKIYFLNISDNIVILFIDDRGSSIETLSSLTKIEFYKVYRDLYITLIQKPSKAATSFFQEVRK